jgi:type II secretory pathway predicted ATPase ExeA
MFLEHFGLVEQPFGVTPDPRFLHLGPKHREALASLVYASEADRGFLALIGPPGMGKTSLLLRYLEGPRRRARTAFLFQAAGNPADLMRYLLADLGADASGQDLPGMHETLDRILAEEVGAGRHLVLAIDEAQNLDETVLESIRLLSNFETPWMKLMQIVLAGQPQLADRLAQPSMAQLRQRISSVIRLEPFTPEETSTYIDHRLWVAGYSGPNLFAASARQLIAEQSGGIPRNINNLCFQSMSLACALEKKQVDSRMVREVISDLAIEPLFQGSPAFQGSAAQRQQRPSTSVTSSGRKLVNVASISAAAFLGIVSGALWKASSHTLRLDATPSVEAAVFPAPATAPAPAPETTTSSPTRSSVTTPTARVGAASGQGAPETAADDRVLTVIVEKGATLRHLSLEYLNRFDPAALSGIRALNPELTDPDHIKSGQQMRLPLRLRRDWQKKIGTPNAAASPSGAEEER